jgi:hypothetical protein
MNNLIRIIFKNGSGKSAASLVKIHHFSQTFILSFLRTLFALSFASQSNKEEEVETAVTNRQSATSRILHFVTNTLNRNLSLNLPAFLG